MSELQHEPSTRGMSSDEMPEIPRELTTLSGAISGLHNSVNNLLARLAPISYDGDQPPEADLRKVPEWQVTSEVSRKLRDLWQEVSALESKVDRAVSHLRV